jgi:hypothetical protein
MQKGSILYKKKMAQKSILIKNRIKKDVTKYLGGFVWRRKIMPIYGTLLLRH